jgi:hypothetical protein
MGTSMNAGSQIFQAHDFVFQINSSEPDLMEVVNDLFVDMVLHGTPRQPVHQFEILPSVETGHLRVLIDGFEQYATLNTGSLISHLLIEVNTQAVAASKSLISIHAGSAQLPNGLAVLFPGQSHSGKTTLVTQLSVLGWRFIADEVSAILPDTLAVVPYGKPVALREASVDFLGCNIPRLRRPGSRFETDERFVPPRELSAVMIDPVPVCMVIFPDFADDANFSCDPVTPGETLTRLTHSLLNRSAMTVNTFRLLERLTNDVPAFHLTYGFGAIQPESRMFLETLVR